MLASTAAAQQPAASDPRELLQKLNALRVDATQVYRVRELTLRRDAVRIALDEGKLAFLAAQDGQITGAVFSGQGRIIVVPRDPVEKGSLARFLGAPLLDESFSRAYFRFTDNTAAELRVQLSRAGAQPFAEPSFAEDWNQVVANLNPRHSLRILADLLAKEPQPYFFAGLAGDGSGAFDVLVDNRRAEQIRIGQSRFVEGLPYFDTWASFTRADLPAPAPPFAPLGYTIETIITPAHTLEGTTSMQLSTSRAGERVVPLEISRRLTVTEVRDDAGHSLTFFKSSETSPEETAMRGDDAVFVVLPVAPATDQTIRLRLAYRGNLPSETSDGVLFAAALGSWYAHVTVSNRFVPFELSFRWPKRFAVEVAGKKLEEIEDGEWRTGKWASDGPIQSARFSLGGQWSGDVVDGSNYRNQWIQEGLANYRALMADESKQPGQLAAQLENYRRALSSAWGENEALDSIGPLSLGYRLRSSKSPRGYAQIIHPKASWAIHMLRMMLRDSGLAPTARKPDAAKTPDAAKAPDERFTRLLQTLLANYRHRALTTADLQREVEKVMTPEMDLEGSRKTPGRPGAMDWFFDQWIRGTGIPKYSVEFDVKPAGDKFVVRGKLMQGGVPASFIARVPIYAPRAAGEKLVLLGNVVTNGAETPFQFTVRAAPKKLLIDPSLTLLCVVE